MCDLLSFFLNIALSNIKGETVESDQRQRRQISLLGFSHIQRLVNAPLLLLLEIIQININEAKLLTHPHKSVDLTLPGEFLVLFSLKANLVTLK